MRAIVLVQYLSQITSVYGQHDAKAFLNSKVKIAFALNDIDDARFFSESLGKKSVKVKSRVPALGIINLHLKKCQLPVSSVNDAR